ncbi:MAG: hypothetical protein FRX49_03112 [Trebouxia sp. A1-2]|nr:MAG: hypothetical protein FRX49_03112 [Trebouxia sp. A1-2]
MIAQTETVNPVSAGEAIQPYYETWNHDDDDACQVFLQLDCDGIEALGGSSRVPVLTPIRGKQTSLKSVVWQLKHKLEKAACRVVKLLPLPLPEAKYTLEAHYY